MSDIAQRRAEARNSPIYREAERISHLFGIAAMQASHQSWARQELMRIIRHATAEWQINESLARLAAMNAAPAEVRL